MAAPKKKLTKEFIQGMAEAVRKDMPDEAACALFRIAAGTYYRWMAQGRKDIEEGIESIESELCETIKKAETEAIQESLDLIKAAGKFPKHWQARAWVLERCYRKWFSLQGDMAEKILAQLAELRARLDKRDNKSVGAKANGELDQEGNQSKTQRPVKKETGR